MSGILASFIMHFTEAFIRIFIVIGNRHYISEKMRQIYINEYLKAAKEYGLRGEYADRKKLETDYGYKWRRVFSPQTNTLHSK